MTYTDYLLKVSWHHRQVMDQPIDSWQRKESITILREIQEAAQLFFTNEKATAGTVADFEEIPWE
jgi:hypothetical protein